MAGLCRWQKRKNHDVVRHGIHPAFLASCVAQRVYEDPALWIARKPEQNEEANALHETDQHTDLAKGKASGSTDDPETDWP